MSILFTSLLLLQSFIHGQQDSNPYALDFIQNRFKGYVILSNGEKIKKGLSHTKTGQIRIFINNNEQSSGDVPTGIAGGALSSVFVIRKYRINGNRKAP